MSGAELERFADEYREFARLNAGVRPRFALDWEERRPCLNDRQSWSPIDPHYHYHTAWAARLLRRLGPAEHVDIGSSLYFAGIVSAFIPIKFFDYRPPALVLPNLTCGRADLLDLPFVTGTITSLSCMHVVEHVGLGRYGDKLDAEGDLRAMAELQRVLAAGGHLLLVVPMGRPRIVFNAHRIYSYALVREALPHLDLVSFTLIADGGGAIIVDAAPEEVERQDYACGCFHFRGKGG